MYLVKQIRSVLSCLLLLSVCSINAYSKPGPLKTNKVFTSQFENVMGTSFEMKIKNVSEKQGTKAETIALQEIDRLSKILSSYDSKSEFNQFLATHNTVFKASPELIEVLSLFDNWKTNTKGALNPAFEVVNQVWKKAAKTNTLPTSMELNEAINNAANIHYTINKEQGTITHLTNTPLAINTFVKSFIIEKAAKKVMDETGIPNIVMNVGGDIAVYGNETEQVAIVNPKASAINDASLTEVKICKSSA